MAHNSAWFTPLATAIAALAAVLTFLAALWIGIKAGSIAEGQKKIAGLAELRAIDELMNKRSMLEARRSVSRAYLNDGNMDRSAAFELLDLMDQVYIYLEEDLVGIDTLAALYSGSFICWWYSVRSVADKYRSEVNDPPLWSGGESLVRAMQAEVRLQSPKWGSDPPDAVMRLALESSLEQIERLLEIMSQSH